MRNREDHLNATWQEPSTISSPQNTHLKILHIDFNVPFTLQNSLQNNIPAYKTHFLIPGVGVKLCLRPIHRTHCYSPNFLFCVMEGGQHFQVFFYLKFRNAPRLQQIPGKAWSDNTRIFIRESLTWPSHIAFLIVLIFSDRECQTKLNDWVSPQKSANPCAIGRRPSCYLASYVKAAQTLLRIFTRAWYFPDNTQAHTLAHTHTHTYACACTHTHWHTHNGTHTHIYI